MALSNAPGTRLTVLFLESSRNFGGQERRIVHEARLLRERGYLPLIACPGDAALLTRAVEAGIEAFAVPMRNAVDPSSILRLCGVVLRHRVDILYSHSGKDSTLGGIVAFLTGRALVRSRELLNPVRRSRSYNLLPKRVLACSVAVRDHLIAAGVDPNKVHVQYPPVATARFRSASPEAQQAMCHELGLDGGFPIVVCVAGFRHEKRQEDLIRAMPMVRRSFPGSLLVLAGSGWYRENLRAIAQEAGVADMVRFAGECEDVPALLAAADVFVLPSSVEPFGMSPVEAMAAGVPVVVTRTGGLAEIVTDGVDGLLVPVHDPDAIAAAIVRICNDPELRAALVTAGRTRALDFDEERAVDGLIGHFLAVVGGGRG